MEIFFTKIDTEIERKIKKDPLREQVIWTKFANELYPTINSTTREMKGYIITSLGLEIMEEMKKSDLILSKNGKEGKTELKKIQVMYEMVIMYMMIEKIGKLNVGFLGKEKGKHYYDSQQGNPFIYMKSEKKEERRILVRQDQLGYIARYRSKLENIEIRKKILNIAFGEELDKFKNFFKKILDKRDRRICYKECFENDEDLQNKNRLLQILEIEEDKKEAYLKALHIKDKNGRTYLYKKIEKTIGNNKTVSAKELIDEILDEKPEEVDENIKKLLEDIKMVENFLVSLNNIFYEVLDKKSLNVSQKNINSIINQYKIICENEKIMNKIFENEKYRKLKEVLNNSNNKNIAKAVIQDHQEIFEKNKMQPWIEIDSTNTIIRNHNIKEDYDNYRWNNYYFIDVVAQIIRSMKPWEK